MKKLFFSLLTLLTTATVAWADVEINATNFPDATFRNWVLSQEYGSDGILTPAEISSVTSIDVRGREMQSLKGIEFFTSLTALYCNNNNLTSLDVSKNTALTTLYCYTNQLTSLDVTNNTALKWLACFENQLTSLDLSKNTVLQKLDCSYNQITTLDVSGFTRLDYLSCSNNQITTLDVSGCTALTTLYCYNNRLASLDVAGCTALAYLSCHNTYMVSLDRINTINHLTSLDVSKNTNLAELNCSYNQLTSLDVSGCTALKSLSCYINQLTSLDVSENTKLTNLACWVNHLTSLDVTNNTALIELQCDNNLLTSLDVSKNTKLTYLNCSGNQLTSLDVSENTLLTNLLCHINQIKGNSMDELIASLPIGLNGKMYVIYNKNEDNEMTYAQILAMKAKGWTPYYYDREKWNKSYAQRGNNIIQEGEYTQDITNYSDDKCTLTRNTIDDERVSQGECLRILPVKSNGTWNVTYNMDGIVPGKYNVHIVTLPKTMTDATATDLPVKYKIELQYNIQDGTEVTNQCGAYSSTQNEITDVVVEGIDIYGGYVNITLSGNANAKKVKTETSEMYLDYIYLEAATSTLRGDVNGDGVVNGTDIQAIINSIVEGEYDEKADVNSDDQVNGTDIQEVINIIVNEE
jgi:Leucine-rich repeat (LRR) protein